MSTLVREMGERDIGALAPMHRKVFAGSMGASLGDRYVRAFFRWFIAGRDTVALVADADGALAGYVIGAPHGHGSRLTRELLPTILGAVATHPAAWRHANFGLQLRTRLGALIGRGSTGSDPYGPETYDLVAIGTNAAFRGRGVASALLRELEVRARARGFERVILHVYSDNASARGLYSGRGYRVSVDAGRVITMEKACVSDS